MLLVDCSRMGTAQSSFPLPRNVLVCTVGRDPKSTICLGKDSSVSRKHCEFVWNTNKLFVRDLKSTFGTFVNDAKCSPQALVEIKANDVVKFGESGMSQFRLEMLPTKLVFCTSGLKNKEKDHLNRVCPTIGAECVDEFDCNTVTHLVIPSKNWRVTSKVLLALLCQKLVVSYDWVLEFHKTGEYPNVQRFLPGPLSTQQVDSMLASSQSQQISQQNASVVVDFSLRKERGTLFEREGLEFVALDDKLMEVDLLRNGGAKVSVLTGSKPSDGNAVLVCSPSVDIFRKQFAHLAHLPAVDKTLIIHAILTISELVPVPGFSRMSPPPVQRSVSPIPPPQQRAPSPVVPPQQRAPPPAAPPQQRAPPPVAPPQQRAPSPVVPPQQRAPSPVVPPQQRAPSPVIPPQQRAPFPVPALEKPKAVVSPPPPTLPTTNVVKEQQPKVPFAPPTSVVKEKPKNPSSTVAEKVSSTKQAKLVQEEEEEEELFTRARIAPSTDHKFEAPKLPEKDKAVVFTPVETAKPLPQQQQQQQKPQGVTVFPELTMDWEWISKKRVQASSSSSSSSPKDKPDLVNIVVEDVAPYKPSRMVFQGDIDSAPVVNFKKFRKNVIIPRRQQRGQDQASMSMLKKPEIEVAMEIPLADKLILERERSELKVQELIMLNAFGANRKAPTTLPSMLGRKPSVKRPAASKKKQVVSSEDDSSSNSITEDEAELPPCKATTKRRMAAVVEESELTDHSDIEIVDPLPSEKKPKTDASKARPLFFGGKT